MKLIYTSLLIAFLFSGCYGIIFEKDREYDSISSAPKWLTTNHEFCAVGMSDMKNLLDYKYIALVEAKANLLQKLKLNVKAENNLFVSNSYKQLTTQSELTSKSKKNDFIMMKTYTSPLNFYYVLVCSKRLY